MKDQSTKTDERSDPFVQWAAAARSLVADRDDLASRIQVAASRATRASTVIAVVGEFKQGKSALVNSLLSESVCPIDDHIATAVVTVISHAAEPLVVVRRRSADGNAIAERVDPGSRRELITESAEFFGDGAAGHGDNSGAVHQATVDQASSAQADRRSIERVDIRLPNRLLEEGLIIVDTPGVGGLRTAHATATRSFLPSADALIFVSDATSELTDTEVQFLTEAVQTCPTVVLALTKTDLFPQWRRIADLDRRHLERAGIDAPTFPVSFPLRVESIRRHDKALDEESGFPKLTDFLTSTIVPQVRAGATSRAIADIERVLESAADIDRSELAALDDPVAAQAQLDTLTTAQKLLAALASGNARWRTVLQDEVTDLSQEVTFRFRDQVRHALETMDGAVDDADDRDALAAATETMRDSVVDAVQHSFDEIEQGIEDISTRVADVLDLEELSIGTPEEIAAAAREAGEVWGDSDDSNGDKSIGSDAFAILRGAQGGILMIAIMGGLLPAAAATVVAAAPFMVGAGVLFGGKQILDLRSQKQLRAKQKLKVTLRKSVDEVQFRVGADLGEALRLAQRHLRDELGRRVEEIHRTTAESAQRIEAALASDSAQRQQRRAAIETRLARHRALGEAAQGLAEGHS